jgi:hypothetical protein
MYNFLILIARILLALLVCLFSLFVAGLITKCVFEFFSDKK